MLIVIIAFCLSALLIILGFVALLKQKTYLDSATLQPVQVEVPVFGKVKTNYPAVLFIVFGSVLAGVIFERAFPPRKVEWRLQGTLAHPQNARIIWSVGTLTLMPSEITPSVNDQGRFEVTAFVEEGKSIEDIYETLDFTHPAGSVHIELKDELKKKLRGEPSLISSTTEHTRTFKPLTIELLSPPE
jgi:hypothetical protein